MSKNKLSRRGFVKGAAVAAGLSTASCAQVVPRHVVGGKGFVPPSETVHVASIGAGGMASADIDAIEGAGGKIVALCDVDDVRAADQFNKHPDVPKYKDYRVMLEKEKGIDGVIVAVPDHLHAVMTMDAMELGKHVYCEKPLAHTMHEVRTVTEASKRYGVATQLGNQGHATESIRSFCRCVQSGAIGHVREVHIVEAGHYFNHNDKLDTINNDYPIPSTLDWDLWLGPAAYRKYNPGYLPGIWRGWTQFGSGAMGDWMCHLLDPVYWALDLGAPKSAVVVAAKDYDLEKHGETFPVSTHVRFEFPEKNGRPPVTVHWYDGPDYGPPRPPELTEGERFIPIPNFAWANNMPFGAMVVGDEGKILYGSHGAAGWRIIPKPKMIAYQESQEGYVDNEEKDVFQGSRHHSEWIRACKGIEPAGSNFADYGGPLTEVPMLGNIALKVLGNEIEWDPKKMRITNYPEANDYLKMPFREGWSL